MGALFQKSGMVTTVQDMGRTGYQKDGFSVSGAMDTRSARIANILVGNPDSEAIIEFVMAGPAIQFTSAAVIAITGGDFDPSLNGNPVPMYRSIKIEKGDILELKFAKTGLWGYIAIAGGIDVPLVMGSRSTNLKCGIGGFQGRVIRNGDELGFRNEKESVASFKERAIEQENFGQQIKNIRVIPGPQTEYFTDLGLYTFFNENYEVTAKADRMGYRLEGPEIEHRDGADIISDGIAFGAIQIPSHGKPIVMLADRQTTGGYTKIGTIASVDIPNFVQSKQGTIIKFSMTTVEMAQKYYRDQEYYFDTIREKQK